MRIRKYWKPRSLTFWLGVLNIALGLALAITQNLEATATLAAILSDLTGGLPAYPVIVGGAALITGRAALKEV